MGIQFVTPEPIRLALSDGDFLLVKNRLTHGDRDAMLSRMAPLVTPGEPLHVETKDMRAVKVATYLVGWSSSVSLSPTNLQARVDTLNGLDPDAFDEIAAAIDAHEAAVDTARAQEKKLRTGVSVSSPTSTSRDGVTGVTSGSVN